MTQPKTQFIRKLHVAFGILLLITVSIAWYFFDSVRSYRSDLSVIARSNDTLHSYQSLAELTWRQLRAMAIVPIPETPSPTVMPTGRALELRQAISAVRSSLDAEAAFDQSGRNAEKREGLRDLEATVEDIIRAGIELDLARSRANNPATPGDPAAFNHTELIDRFDRQMGDAIARQRADVLAQREQAAQAADFDTGVLALVMFIMVLVTGGAIFYASRNLTRSLNLLHEAVTNFTAGDLQHRIPAMNEAEFHELGRAFNTMARELNEHRTGMHDANVKLEAAVEERTRALKESNDKLERVDETRRKLLADISHEFRTPLTIIKGESEVALRAQNQTAEEYQESLRRIVETADHTTRLVDDLLFIVRADSGEPRLESKAVSLNTLIEKTVKEFEAAASQQEVRLHLEIKPRNAEVRGDPGRLRQVFTILLDNAIRYSNAGDEVRTRVDAEEGNVLIIVRDEGIGLTDEEAEKAFTRFYRGRRAVRHARGTGLGLPVAKAIVEAHRGTISLEGKPGEGAIATVTLPMEGSVRVSE